MTTEDAVEDYLIYAYFELDHPRRCYVGKTLQSRAEQRDQEHRSGESGAKKFNAFVQNEIIFGDRDFDDVLRYEILEHFTGTAQECAEREGEHIQRKNSIENGWNLKTEGTGNGLLFPSTPPGEHGNRPPIRRSKLHIQGDLDYELIQDVIEFGLEQSILEKDKEYTIQELKTLIAKSYVAQTYQTLNLTVQEPSPDEIKSVLNDWTKLENTKNNGIHKIWWEKQLKASGFERPLIWKNITNIIRLHCGTVHSSSPIPIVQWLKGNPISLDINLPRRDKKWVCYGGSEDVWQGIRFRFLAKFPNTLQEIEEKEEQERLQREREEREERERLQRKKEEAERLQRDKEAEKWQKAVTKFVYWLFAILALGLVFVAIIFGESSSSNSPKPIPEDIQARSPKPKPAETIQDRLYRWREIKRQRRIDQPITDAPNVSPAPSNFPTAEDMAFASRRVADGMTWEQALRLARKNRTKTRQ